MSEFTIDGQIRKLTILTPQKRVVALYQRALREEGEPRHLWKLQELGSN